MLLRDLIAQLCHRTNRNCDQVLDVLQEHGGVASLQAGARGSARCDVEQAFVAIFDMALARASQVDQFDTALDWVADLRGRLPWGYFLGEDLFIELFLGVGRARQDWHASPREPFNVSSPCYTPHTLPIRSVVLELWPMLTVSIHSP